MSFNTELPEYEWTEEEVEYLRANNDGKKWEVDAIVDHEFRAGYLFYKVEWSGEWYPTYEPVENLYCDQLLKIYHKKIGRDPRKANY